MARLTIEQMRGAKDLLQDAVEATVNVTAQAHRSLARRPYAVLVRIGAIAVPVRAVERIQSTITDAVYLAILSATRIGGAAASGVLDCVEILERHRR